MSIMDNEKSFDLERNIIGGNLVRSVVEKVKKIFMDTMLRMKQKHYQSFWI